jgi:hypothetical protein
MTLQFQNTREDYYESMKFIIPKTWGLRWYITLIFGILMMLIGIAFMIYKATHLHDHTWYAPDQNGQMQMYQQKETLRGALITPALLVLLGVVYLLLHSFRARMLTKRLLKQQAFLLEPTEIEFSDAGIEIRRPASKANMQWSIVKAIYERPDFFGILFNGNSFIPVMKKHLSETEYTELKKLLSARKEILTK